MNFIKKIYKRWICKHKNKEFIQNIYGDKNNYLNYRSVWKCKDCGKFLYENELFLEK